MTNNSLRFRLKSIMAKTPLDPHISGPRISADQLVMAVLFCLPPFLMWLGLGPPGTGDFASDDLGTSLSALAVANAVNAILVIYMLTVATGAFELFVGPGRFCARDLATALACRLGTLMSRYSRTSSIQRAFAAAIAYGAADAPLSWNQFLQTPRILVQRWFAGTSPHLLFH